MRWSGVEEWTNHAASVPTARPLLVALDGCLLRGDPTLERLCALLSTRPATILRLPLWLSRGTAAMAGWAAEQAPLDPSTLPLNDALVAHLRAEKESGRLVYLESNSDPRLAEAVADHLGLFDGVLSAEEARRLRDQDKVEPVDTRADAKPLDPWACLLAMRPHQWAKNALLFAPMLAAHRLDAAVFALVSLAALAFSLTASATYLVNDLLDLDSDRRHPRKRRRPLASGRLPLDHGMILAALLLTAGLGGAALVSGAFFAVLLLYVVVTLAYSTLLKPLLMLDVVALAGLHALRVFAGGIAAGVTVSSWLLTLSIFLFLCLAIVKRHAELSDRRRAGARTAPGRGYTTDDLPVLAALGGAAGCSAVVVLALYIQSPEVKALYATPDILWAVCPILLYWISRALLLSGRDAMQDDPVLFALRDPVSLACGALVGIAAWLAS